MSAGMPQRLFALVLLAFLAVSAQAADLVALSPQTLDRYIPQGKEVDGIYGDFVLANDQIVAVVAHPKRGRNANMTVRDVGGCLIDLTRRDRQNDQLSAFYPGGQLRDLKFAGIEVEAPCSTKRPNSIECSFGRGASLCGWWPRPAKRSPTSRYPTRSRTAGPTCWSQPRSPTEARARSTPNLLDAIRADRTFEIEPRDAGRLVLGLRQGISARPTAWSPTGTRFSAPMPGDTCFAIRTATEKSPSRCHPAAHTGWCAG